MSGSDLRLSYEIYPNEIDITLSSVCERFSIEISTVSIPLADLRRALEALRYRDNTDNEHR